MLGVLVVSFSPTTFDPTPLCALVRIGVFMPTVTPTLLYFPLTLDYALSVPHDSQNDPPFILPALLVCFAFLRSFLVLLTNFQALRSCGVRRSSAQ